MNRKGWFALCFAAALCFRIYGNMHDHTHTALPLLLVPFVLGWVAFMLPAVLPVVMVEDVFFHFAPYADGHTPTTLLYATLLACLIWFFPAARIARWFGAFDGFQEGLWLRLHRWLHLPEWMRSLSLWRGLDFVHEQANKRLFGRQKTGGWA